MSIDLTRITPAPWFAKGEGICCGVYQGEYGKQGVPIDLQDPTWADAQFIALARNAFDVMMRRGWHTRKVGGKWHVVEPQEHKVLYRGQGMEAICIDAGDPFTALVEADKWYAENVEAKQS